MPVIGLDPSLTNFGWVLLNEMKSGKDSLIEYGTFKTSTKDGLRVQRLILQRERLRKLLSEQNVGLVSMEAPYWQDFSTEILFALNQFIHEVFLDLGILVIYIQPLSLKKQALPDMNPQEATKHHMTHQAKKELDKVGHRFSEHVSDAYFAAKVGCRFYLWHCLQDLKDDDLTESEKHLFCGKHTFVRGLKKGLTEYTGIIYRENDQIFDYRKQARKTNELIKEIQNAKKKD